MNINAEQIIKDLILKYGDEKCALNFSSPYELLVAVILSAQCTDVRVNKVTSELFKVANTPEKMLLLGQEKLAAVIKSCGLFRAKSKSIIDASKSIVENYNGKVPNTFNELVSLRGVGEKTASVVLAVAFSVPAFAVDTHVFRVSNRIGIIKETTPHNAMESLKKVVPEKYWIDGHYALVLHGRNCCKARNPECEMCLINKMCLFYNSGKGV